MLEQVFLDPGIIHQSKVLYRIIIGDNRHFGFGDAGLMEEYNSDFLSLKGGRKVEPKQS